MLILAHRGASDARLENTLAAFTHAIERGADGVELDVQLSRDGEVIVFHDHDLARLAGRQEKIEHLTWDELSRVALHQNNRIPRLVDVLEHWPTDRWLNVELMKNAACMVGNSSAGVREAPFLGLPSLDIGTRQSNRSDAPSVIA